jgi:hypothetical protein
LDEARERSALQGPIGGNGLTEPSTLELAIEGIPWLFGAGWMGTAGKVASHTDDAADVARILNGPIGLPTPRSGLLNGATDGRLRNAIDNLYRPNARIGSGSSMDAVRFEKATGQLLSPTGHVQKLLDRRTQLTKLLSDPTVSANDRLITKRLLIDIQDALSR